MYSSLFQVPKSSAGSYLSLFFMEKPPITMEVKLKKVESCQKANIFVFDKSRRECILESDTTSGAITKCVYRCRDTRSTIVSVGFIKANFGPQKWTICSVAEMRNIWLRTIDVRP